MWRRKDHKVLSHPLIIRNLMLDQTNLPSRANGKVIRNSMTWRETRWTKKDSEYLDKVRQDEYSIDDVLEIQRIDQESILREKLDEERKENEKLFWKLSNAELHVSRFHLFLKNYKEDLRRKTYEAKDSDRIFDIYDEVCFLLRHFESLKPTDEE